MSSDPFSKSPKDPFHSKKANPSFPSDIFNQGVIKPAFGGGGGGRARKPDPVEEEPYELLDIPSDAPVEPEKPKPSVILRNPKWEVEKVGFNEETDISVEIELPEEHAYKTKVVFELFAKTPKEPERVVKGEGHAEGGKAKCRIPIYIPKFKDEDGNRMEKVEYYFTAKHSESVLLDGSKTPKTVTEMSERLIESHILPDVTFAFDKSFLHPKHATALKDMCAKIKDWLEKNSDGKLAVFGHADAVGKEDYNKALSERRAKSVFGFLMKDAEAWSDLDKEEKWGLACIQDLLKHLGHDPGESDGQDGPKTQAAVKEFQTQKSLSVDGVAGPITRTGLYQAFMDDCNGLSLKKKNFDDINGNPTTGCSEFNLVEKTEGACEANRRVAVLLLKSNKNFPISYPCQKGDLEPCKGQIAKQGERRTAGFGCKFYDGLVQEGTLSKTITFSLGMTYTGESLSGRKYIFDCGGEKQEGVIAEDGKITVEIRKNSSEANLKVDPGSEGFSLEWKFTLTSIPSVEEPKGLQIRLNNLGFFCGEADGEMGKRTRVAVRSFQQRYGLLAHGESDEATRKKVSEVYGG